MSSFEWPPTSGGGGGGSGTVTSVSIVAANGFAGTVASATTTPAITLTTSITGLLQGNGTAISAATTGNLTDVGTDGITVTGGTGAVLGTGTSIAQAVATASQNGYLASTDWTTFNGKQAAGSYITALSGDVVATGPGSAAATIQAGAVTLAKQANLAANSIIGNNTGSPATPIALTVTQVTAMLNTFTSTLKGLVPLSGGGTTTFLRADGTFAAPAGSGTVTTVSVVSANGFGGTVANATTTPAITLTTSITGLLKGSSSALVAATVGTDYSVGTSALATGILKSTTTTGALSIATAADIPSVLTTKGDLLSYSTLPVRHAVPGDYGEIIADAAQTDGWRSATYLTRQIAPNKNYIQYSDFENGATTGWALGVTGTLTNGLPTGTPTFGSGAAGTLSLATVSSGQIAGATSLSVVSTGATTAGNQVASNAYTIDAEDQARVLSIRVPYKIASGTAALPGTSSNNLGLALWDATNSAWLPVVGAFNFVQTTGVGIATGTFQTALTTASIRLCIYFPAASSGALTFYLDDVFVGPQVSPQAPSMSDWNNATTTVSTATWGGIGTPTIRGYYWRRVGDSVTVSGQIISGTVAAAAASIPLPPGLTIDATKVFAAATGSSDTMGGQWSSDGSNQSGNISIATTASTTVVYCGLTSAGSITPANGNVIVGSTSSFTFRFTVPVTGWSSNTVSSADTDTRVNSCTAALTTAVTPSANAVIKYDTVLNDTNGMYSISTGQVTIPVSGIWDIYAFTTAAGTLSSYLVVNGTSYPYLNNITGAGFSSGGAITLSFKAGDVVSIFTDTSRLLTGASGQRYLTYASFTRRSGPAVITATESVNMRYTNTAGTSVANTGDNNVPFATKDFDSHNAYNTSTGIYTIPVSGKYSVKGTVNYASSTYGVNNQLIASVYKNAALHSYGDIAPVMAIVTLPFGSVVDTTVNCLAGDQLEIRAQNTRTAGATLLNTGAGFNHVEMERIGN